MGKCPFRGVRVMSCCGVVVGVGRGEGDVVLGGVHGAEAVIVRVGGVAVFFVRAEVLSPYLMVSL